MFTQYCEVASDYLGLGEKECQTVWDKKAGLNLCEYFAPKMDYYGVDCGTSKVPLSELKICGNCIFYFIKEVIQNGP